MFRKNQRIWLRSIFLVLAINCAWAQEKPSTQTVASSDVVVVLAAPLTLKQAFDAAWQRQPEAKSQLARQHAVKARRQAADSLTPEPVAIEISGKTSLGLFNKNQGGREIVAGLSIPLWLPGERASTSALADAELIGSVSRITAAQLRTAGAVREVYWLLQRTRIEHDMARERVRSAQQLAVDVAKRVKAGDLAKADQFQADGAVASAEVSLAEIWSVVLAATQQWQVLVDEAGYSADISVKNTAVNIEAMPELPKTALLWLETHPALIELRDRSEISQRLAELALNQTRMNPELSLAISRDRGQSSDPYQQAIAVGIRIPFGSDQRNHAKISTAQAEAIEAQTLTNVLRVNLVAQLDAARQRLESVQAQVVAANKRAQLAKELRGFIQKSFGLGQSDLPTRLRIESEAMEAERQAARVRVDLAAAVSALRQALGLLPT